MGQLASKVRAKYPGAYDDLSDQELEYSVLAKHPEYSDLADKNTTLLRPNALDKYDTYKPSEGDLSGMSVQVPQDEPSLWNKANAPLIDIRKRDPRIYQASEAFAKEHPYIGGGMNKLVDTMSSMTSPLSLGLGTITGGANLAEKSGLETLANILHTPGKIAAGGMMAHGLYNVYDQADQGSLPGVLGGIAEAGLGGLGLRGLAPKGEMPMEGANPYELSPLQQRLRDININTGQMESDGVLRMPPQMSPEQVPMQSEPLGLPSAPNRLALPSAPERLQLGGHSAGIPLGPSNIMSGLDVPATPERLSLPEPSQTQLGPSNFGDVNSPEMVGSSSRLGRLLTDETGAARLRSGAPLDLQPPTGSAKLASSIRSLVTKGKLPSTKIEDFQLGQADVDALAKEITDAPHLNEAEKLNATTSLTKILAGDVPDPSEINGLRRAFGDEFTNSIRDLSKADIESRKKLVSQVVNVPRTIMASYDLSAPMRQGLGLIHRPEYWKSFGTMFKSFGSENAYRAAQDYVTSLPTHKLAVNSGLALTDIAELSKKEEAFMSSKFIENVPVIGKMISPGINASERAYTSFLNKLRADTFQSLTKDAMRAGMNPAENEVLAKSIAKYVNNATGRGSLGSFEHSAVGLNSVFFSPRLMASRLQMLNPNSYIRLGQEYGAMSPEAGFIRQQYLKSLFGIAAFGGTLTSLAKLNGAKVESDANSSDFGKIKIGNTRIDPWGGFQQYLVLANRLISGEQKSSISGQTVKLGSSPVVPTRLGVAARFGMQKLNPVANFAMSMLNGKDVVTGQPFNVGPEAGKMFVPMVMQDIYSLAKSDPSMLPIVAPAAVFGMGTQTYGP